MKKSVALSLYVFRENWEFLGCQDIQDDRGLRCNAQMTNSGKVNKLQKVTLSLCLPRVLMVFLVLWELQERRGKR